MESHPRKLAEPKCSRTGLTDIERSNAKTLTTRVHVEQARG
jgi:hypothetical protein